MKSLMVQKRSGKTPGRFRRAISQRMGEAGRETLWDGVSKEANCRERGDATSYLKKKKKEKERSLEAAPENGISRRAGSTRGTPETSRLSGWSGESDQERVRGSDRGNQNSEQSRATPTQQGNLGLVRQRGERETSAAKLKNQFGHRLAEKKNCRAVPLRRRPRA